MSNIDKQAVQAVADLKAGYTLGHADVEIIQQMTLDAVTLLDELEAKDKRIAELEAREVVLPRSFNREIFGEGMYEVPNGNWMHRKDVTEALLAAGIITKVGE
ncbi:hypothetical protein ABHD38_25175 [Enterobacter cloacae]|uniref:hypothetical protein n=1 Tax=Enterobacter cloacae TaxID=550 RepID=UPI00325BF44F